MQKRNPTPTHPGDVYWALLNTLRPVEVFQTPSALHALAVAGYDAQTLLDAALQQKLIKYCDVQGLTFRLVPDRLLSTPRPAFYDAHQFQLGFVDRAGRRVSANDSFDDFGRPPARPAAGEARRVRYFPVNGQLGRELSLTVAELHARLLAPPPHLRAMAEMLATCPPASYPAYETLQDGICFQSVDGPEGQTPAVLVLQLALAPFTPWAEAWHALLSDENLDPTLLLLFTQASGRHLTAVVEVPAALSLREARRSYANYFRTTCYASAFAAVTILDDEQLAYVVADEWAYRRADAPSAPAASAA